jgi:hypothetical protein
VSDLLHAEAQMIMARPWDKAESESIWEINGVFPKKSGSFENCLAIALPHYATGGEVLFKMIGALNDLISPSWITSAKLLVLVHADDPTTAYYADDQEYIEVMA